jgi:uncharacterized protein YbjT (DUF2867 family)
VEKQWGGDDTIRHLRELRRYGAMAYDVFVTGGTGYIGRHLVPLLLARGHSVRALTRPESARRVPAGAQPVLGNPLDAVSVRAALRFGDTLVHLVGTPHPSPSKAAEFLRVDLASVKASVAAARTAGVKHFVYVSVAQPAPIMKAYIAARAEGERAIAEAGLSATVLRPWYVLGPGHHWPRLLVPLYAAASLVPPLREGTRRLGLVTLKQMVAALAHAVDHPPLDKVIRVLDVPAIRQVSSAS